MGAMKKSIYSAEYAVLCRSLKAARANAGLTQRALASQLKVSPSWVAKVEMGERRVDVIEFVRFIRACGGNVAGVMEGVLNGSGGKKGRS
jgi:transcriptional regulator with XRE-family HTH domain